MNLSSGCCYLYGSHLIAFITEQTMSIHSKTTQVYITKSVKVGPHL